MRAQDPQSIPRAAILAAAGLIGFLSGCASSDVDRSTEDASPTAASSAMAELGDAAEGLPSIAKATKALARHDGFLPLYVDESENRVLAEARPGDEILYVVSLTTGLGSNDVGLDRGQLGPHKLLEFRRPSRDRLLLVEPNLAWRTSHRNPAVQRVVAESFAESVVWGFEVTAESDGRTLVDITDFLLRDAHGLAGTLARTGQGRYQLDRSRSAILGHDARGFPDNSDVEVLLTLTTDEPGREVRSTSPDPESVTFRVRHSFVRLPDDGYRPRRFDPRCGFYELSWRDTAAPIDEPTLHQVIARHRLEKRHPDRARSEAVEPIVYYVDNGAPEPVRTALLEGARYWVPVFEKAGFTNGFQVEVLPEDADIHDVRYNVIQWVERSTRGWSYGSTITDPRTGEIIKGHVTLGALRVRQDVLLLEGLLSPYESGVTRDEAILEAALDRIRQLAAHEVGHTLGLQHNFAASITGRASVMDYPAPLVTLGGDGGTLEITNAYRDGCGEWDEVVIDYGYSQPVVSADVGNDPARRARFEDAALDRILDDAERSGLVYLTDEDARGNDRAHPLANLWDNGADPLAQWPETVRIRALALERFSPAAIKPGRPLAELEEVLVPLYFHHRFQLEAVVRAVAGVDYDYLVRGKGAGSASEPAVRPVDAERQVEALEAAIVTLDPTFLRLPDRILAMIPPRPPGSRSHRELFRPGALFIDPYAAAAAGADLTLSLLLDPARATRLVDQPSRDASLLSLGRVLQRLVDVVWSVPGGADAVDDAIRGEVRTVTLEHLLTLASDPDVPVRVQSVALVQLVMLRDRLVLRPGTPDTAWELDQIRRFFEDPAESRVFDRSYRLPPGSPIGCDAFQPSLGLRLPASGSAGRTVIESHE